MGSGTWEDIPTPAADLADLDDVSLTTPKDGQVLTYDDTNDEWVNADAPEYDVTKTVSGNPIEFDDGADAPLVKCVSAITGSQDLHGYDKPWVGGAGKNKLPYATSSTQTGVSFTVGDDGSVHIVADGTLSSATYISIYVSLTVGNTYTASGISGSGDDKCRIYLRKSDGSATAIEYFTSGSKTWTQDAGDNAVGEYRIRVSAGAVLDVTVYPMIELGSTATSYTPYSNICPITAYTEGEIEVVGDELGGINGMAPGEEKTETINGVTFTSDGKGRYTLRGTASAEVIFVVSCNEYVIPDGSNNAHSFGLMNNASVGVTFYFYNGDTQVTDWSLSPTNRISSYSGMGNKVCNSYRIKCNNGATVDVDFSPMICAGNTSAFPSTFSTYYKYYTHTTTFPSAIFRGSEDAVNGSVSSESGELTENDFSSVQGTTSGGLHYVELTNLNSKADGFCLCNKAEKNNPGAWESTVPVVQNQVEGKIRFYGDFSTLSEFQTKFAGLQIVYEYKTPTTSSVTPTNLPVKSLSGYTHIESSTGDMEVEYITQREQAVIDLIERSQHVYSTQEQVVGTWIDGNPIYEKTLYISSPQTGDTAIPHGITNPGMLISAKGSAYAGTGFGWMNIPTASTSSTYMLNLYGFDATNIHLEVGSAYSGSVALQDTYVTIQYTKATQTRSTESLSKGGSESQEEPLVDKADKVDKEVENDEKETHEEPVEEKEEPVEEEPVEEPSEEEEQNEAER